MTAIRGTSFCSADDYAWVDAEVVAGNKTAGIDPKDSMANLAHSQPFTSRGVDEGAALESRGRRSR